MLRAQRTIGAWSVGTRQLGRSVSEMRGALRNGRIGDLRNVHIAAARNITPGFRSGGPGAAARRTGHGSGRRRSCPGAPHCLHHFRWFWDYSGGQTTAPPRTTWMMGDRRPARRVVAMGGRYSLTGIGETSDLVEALLDYPGFVLNWTSHEASAKLRAELVFYGTKGSMRLATPSLEVSPIRIAARTRSVVHHPAALRRIRPGGARAAELDGYEQVRDQFVPRREFLECVKSRRSPTSDLAHQTATSCHLVNIALGSGGVSGTRTNGTSWVIPRSVRLLTKLSRPGMRAPRPPFPRLTCASAFATIAPVRAGACSRAASALLGATWPGTGSRRGRGRPRCPQIVRGRMRQGAIIRGASPGQSNRSRGRSLTCASPSGPRVPDGRRS
jgi:predicted dehydrogenase